MKYCIKGKSTRLSTSFVSTEFDCRGNGCCKQTKVDEKLIGYLQKIRNHFGKSVRINSGYRCEYHNKKVGGSSNSQHIKGRAADIVVSGIRPIEVAKYAESIGMKGIGLYPSFVHVDTRTTKFYWCGHEQEHRTTFGGNGSGAKIEFAKSFSKAFVGSYKTTDSLNMRIGAGTNKSLLITIPKGKKVICHGYYTTIDKRHWYCVDYINTKGDKYTGFVSSGYLSKK